MLEETAAADDVAELLDRPARSEAVQSNGMFQLALMLARVAAEPCPELYRQATAHALPGLIRAKPKTDVLRLFRGGPKPGAGSSESRAAG